MRRREFLKLSAFAAAAGPTMFIPRYARATPASGAVKHLLILYAKGGLRSHATFNAGVAFQHNPYGVQQTASGTEWSLGAACGADRIETSMGSIPSFAEVTNQVAVIDTLDHLPGGDSPEVDHRSGANRLTTGFPDGTSAILAMIGKHHPAYINGFSAAKLPPAEIFPSEFGMGAGEYAPYRPLSILGPTQSFSSELAVGKGWKIGAREVLDKHFLETRARSYRPRIAQFIQAKRNTAIFADVLKDPVLDLLNQPEREAQGFSNRELIEIFGNDSLINLGDMIDYPSWGADIALALRFFGFGAPVAVVTREIYDTHDDEKNVYGPRTKDLVRQLAGLAYALPKMPHPDGGTYWDHTMVAVVSEFSRNNSMPETGFNSGFGSDHVVDDPNGPQRNQCVALMGGVVTARGKRLGGTDQQCRPIGKVYSSRALLSTFLDVVGVDHRSFFAEEPITELFT
jgi:hypothetical protein